MISQDDPACTQYGCVKTADLASSVILLLSCQYLTTSSEIYMYRSSRLVSFFFFFAEYLSLSLVGHVASWINNTSLLLRARASPLAPRTEDNREGKGDVRPLRL